MLGRFSCVVVAACLLAHPAAAAPKALWDTCETIGGDSDVRIAACEKILKGKESTADRARAIGNIGHAWYHGKAGGNDRAIAEYTRSLELFPTSLVAFRRGLAYMVAGDRGKAVADYTRALELDPKNQEAWHTRGVMRIESGELDGAVADLTRAVEFDPSSTASFAMRGVALLRKGEFERAVADLTQALTNEPDSFSYLSNRCLAYAESGDPDRAVADCDKALTIQPDEVWTLNNRAYALSRRGDHQKALADAEKVVSLTPDRPNGYTRRGVARQGLGDLAGARGDIEKALGLDPAYGKAKDALAALAEAEAKRKTAAPAGDPARLRLHCESNAGDVGVRIAACTALMEIGSPADRARAALNRGRAHLDGNKDHARAIADFSRVLELDPQSADAYFARGNAYQARGGDERTPQPERTSAYEQAILDFRRSRELNEAAIARLKAAQGGKPGAAVATTTTPAPAGSAPPAPQPLVEAAKPTPAAAEALAALAPPAVPPVAASLGRRVALVIGNAAYEHTGRLPNPANDAKTVAEALRKLGFAEVTLVGDLGKQAMERALIAFADQSQGADWAVVYYAGHGMELDGVNYLVPVDARLRQDRHVRLESVSLDDVLEAASGARTMRLVILDACRDNPFLKQMTRSSASRSIGRGLAAVEPSGGTLIAYAAMHGQIADDGSDGNSPFVRALVQHMQEPGLDVRLMFARVRDTVMEATNRAQQPYTYGSLPGSILSFRPASP